MKKTTAAAALAVWAAVALAAQPAIQGKVTQVIDGQTVLVTPADGKPLLQVRLAGIEAPLPCQTWGPDSRDALKDWVLNRDVVVTPASRPEPGRVTGTLTLEGDNISRRMVEEGHAWSERQKWDRGPYVKQERMAHALARGLHGTPGAVPPKEFRRTHGLCV